MELAKLFLSHSSQWAEAGRRLENLFVNFAATSQRCFFSIRVQGTLLSACLLSFMAPIRGVLALGQALAGLCALSQ